MTKETQDPMEMNLFGMADASEFSDNPFEVDPGTYFAVCVDATLTQKDDGNRALKLVWQIEEPDSEFNGNKVSQYQTIIMKLARDMDPDEKKTMKFFKMNLRNAFDLSEEEMNTFKPQDILGRKAYITTKINDIYTNITRVLSESKYKEQNAQEDVSVSSGFGI